MLKAVRAKNIDTIKKILSSKNPNQFNEDKDAALFIAASMGSKEIVEILLLNNKATVNIQKSGGNTPLFSAARGSGENYQETVEYLLSHGADPEKKINMEKNL